MVAIANPGRNPPEIDVLRWEDEPDRFRHVYRDDAGGGRPNKPWLAKIKVGGVGVVRLGRHPTPRAAAAACLSAAIACIEGPAGPYLVEPRAPTDKSA